MQSFDISRNILQFPGLPFWLPEGRLEFPGPLQVFLGQRQPENNQKTEGLDR